MKAEMLSRLCENHYDTYLPHISAHVEAQDAIKKTDYKGSMKLKNIKSLSQIVTVRESDFFTLKGTFIYFQFYIILKGNDVDKTEMTEICMKKIYEHFKNLF